MNHFSIQYLQRCFSHSESEDRKNEKIRLTKFQFISLSLVPLPVAIFTLITTIQTRQIANVFERKKIQK